MGSSPTIASILAAIKTSLDVIAGPIVGLGGGAGKVHNRPRHTISDAEVQSDFLDTDAVLRATWVDVLPPREEEDIARYKYWVVWRFQITHVRHFDDEGSSFEEFLDEVERIKDQIRADETIFGIPAHDTQRVLNVTIMEFANFTTRLVHQATMDLEVEASEVISP